MGVGLALKIMNVFQGSQDSGARRRGLEAMVQKERIQVYEKKEEEVEERKDGTGGHGG